MVADARRLAAAATALALGLAPAAVGAVQRTNLADLCTEGGAGPVTEDTLVLRTMETIPFFCVIDLVDASLRIVGTEIAAPSLSIVRAGAGAVEITGSEIEVEGAFSITGGTGPVRIVDSALSGTNNSEIDISGDIRIRHSTLSLDTQSSATFLVFATDDGAVDIAASSLSARADSFGLIELMAPQGLMLRSVELIAEAIELLPQDGGDLVFVNNVVAGGSPGAGGPAVISLPASSDPGAVVVVGNTFAAGATFRFDAGVQADRCVIEANDPEAAVIGAEDACP